jgi:hypothetical protein
MWSKGRELIRRIIDYLIRQIQELNIKLLKHTFSYAFLTILFWRIFEKFISTWELVSFLCFILIVLLSLLVEIIEYVYLGEKTGKELTIGVVYAFAGFFLGSMVMLQPFVALLLTILMVLPQVGVIITTTVFFVFLFKNLFK